MTDPDFDERLQRDRERIQTALQDSDMRNESYEGPVGGSMVVGWVVVCESVDPAGERWLTMVGSENSTQWQRQGYLHNALNTRWEGGVADDD